jgi:phage baseplate assembly protein W
MSEKRPTLGKDLRLKYDDLGADLNITSEGDLETVSAEDNLVQAIIDRLATDEGELYDVGHADYGSRLYEFIGEVNNEATRDRIKGLVMDCLRQESRIREVTSISVKTSPHDQSQLDIEITVLPTDGSPFLTITYPFRLET